ncbi:Synaptotagmin-6 [Willisornis vidua]|uniref:Synaptotagmin-6 n=1 Tax=Willisornis vidua TaxID=1566151 RepID=A0ABQ9CP76_9PASS|nr:Synaptotagmin-6 [Willisornis vidua]
MPGDREDEICQKALQLLAELCSVGAVENENCRDFIYYLRDRARPRLSDSDAKAECVMKVVGMVMAIKHEEGHGSVGASPEEATKVIGEMEHLSCKERLRKLGVCKETPSVLSKLQASFNSVGKHIAEDVFIKINYISISLLSLVVTACGLALFGVSLFVSWKLCWIPWRERGLPFGGKDNKQESLNYTDTEPNERDYSEDYLGQPTAYPEASMKISHTSPDIPLDTQAGTKENCVPNVRMQRQITEPTSSARHNSIRRQLNLSNPDFNIQQVQKQEQLTGIGRIKPELYKQRSVDTDDGRRSNSKACGKLNFILKYDCDLEQLIVKIHKAINLPAKDFSGTSDPYVKIYLLPDRKTKHQTKVHRKTLNPVFDEVFLFSVPYNDLNTRKLHFSVYDFDRFSRHDLIGQVVVDNFLDLADFPRECNIWKDIEYVTNDNVDLGDLMFSLCYLPTAGRLTITIIKARNLKAMDITGASDPYVKVSLMCEGRRLKKRKTSTKRNTLNPVYNEAIVFDVPPENIDQINLSIAVMDYDRVGHNEVIGVCQVGNDAESLGRDHWNEMLSYPRKPIAHWHPLVEGPIQQECYAGLLRLDGCRRGFLTLLTYSAEIWHSC